MATQNGSAESVTKPRAVRGKWTDQQREEIVAATMVAGASINEVAERFRVRAALISAWRRRPARAGTADCNANKPARFAAVRVNRTADTDGVIEIDQSNGCIRVRGIVDAGMLREVLAATR